MDPLDHFIADVEAAGADEKLYTQAELDAAVQAERMRCCDAVQRTYSTWPYVPSEHTRRFGAHVIKLINEPLA